MLTELEKRIERYFFAEEHFRTNDMNEYWLSEMKFNRTRILEIINNKKVAEAEAQQYKLFNTKSRKKK